MDTAITILSAIFSSYFVILTVVCGLFLSFVYPYVLIDSEFKMEYKIGKIIGYVYIGGSLLFFFIIKLFG